jgi:GntR family transcriptional regulator
MTAMSSTIRNSALYTQVRQQLLDAIQSGTYKIGEKIPTEHELCQVYNVSRTTVRLALQQLELEGRIKKKQGKGTFVTKHKITHRMLAPIMSFPEHMQELGRRSNTKVLESLVVPAESPVDISLHIPAKSPVTKLVRLRIADDEIVSYDVSYIPWQVAPGLCNDDCTGSLFKLLKEKYGLQIIRSIDTLEPFIVDDARAKQLNIESGSPSFLIKTVSYIKDNTPIEYSESIFRGDTSKFIVERYHDLNK